jgi:hypothetical protein
VADVGKTEGSHVVQDASSLYDENAAYGAHSQMQGANSRFTFLGISPSDEHPSKRLPPVDLLLCIDNSGSIGMVNFQVRPDFQHFSMENTEVLQKVKDFACKVLDNMYIKAGKSRVACVTFSTQPDIAFSFDRFNSLDSVKGRY